MPSLRDPGLRSVEQEHRRLFAAEWMIGAIGTVATATGLWMRYLSEANLAEAWPFAMIIAGALLLFVSFDRAAQKLADPTGRPVTWVALAALASLAAVVAFALMWLL